MFGCYEDIRYYFLRYMLGCMEFSFFALTIQLEVPESVSLCYTV